MTSLEQSLFELKTAVEVQNASICRQRQDIADMCKKIDKLPTRDTVEVLINNRLLAGNISARWKIGTIISSLIGVSAIVLRFL
jgi:hypothetical protein